MLGGGRAVPASEFLKERTGFSALKKKNGSGDANSRRTVEKRQNEQLM